MRRPTAHGASTALPIASFGGTGSTINNHNSYATHPQQINVRRAQIAGCFLVAYIFATIVFLSWLGASARSNSHREKHHATKLPTMAASIAATTTTPATMSPEPDSVWMTPSVEIERPPASHLDTPDPAFAVRGCELVSKVLKEATVDESLPVAGKASTDGIVFWLKTPVTRHLLDSKHETVLLKYNKYLPTQHTEKWTNTQTILTKYNPSVPTLPRLYAQCRDPGDGFHYILVEWIAHRPSQLPPPASFEGCVGRADAVLDALVQLDRARLALLDVKPGQWMSRTSSSESPGAVVLQDADDIVETPWRGEGYEDQIENAMRAVQRSSAYVTEEGRTSPDLSQPRGAVAGAKWSFPRVHEHWHLRMFPSSTYTIRYTMILLSQMIRDDLGFRWSKRECPAGSSTRVEFSEFLRCFDRVLIWAATPAEDWPIPQQVRDAVQECAAQGWFTLTERPRHEAWHELAAADRLPESYVAPSACQRPYGPPKNARSGSIRPAKWCGDDLEGVRSCCRGKTNGEDCYYSVPSQECA